MNLSIAEHEELSTIQRSRTRGAGDVRRTRLVLLLDQGATREQIKADLRCDSRFIATWKQRIATDRLAGL